MGLLGDFTSFIDSKKRIAADRLAQLASDPSGLLSRAGADVSEQVMPFINAAERGDTPKVIEGLLGSNLVSPLIFAGVGAKTANKGLLAQAQQMTKEGADPGTVWRTTGWTDQFPDKKWRFEIPDTELSVGIPAKIDKGLWSTTRYEHPQYEAAYPEIKKETNAIVQHGARARHEGSYNARLQSVGRPPEIYAGGIDEPAARSVLAHELQHAVQQREGFAKGGSPDTAPALASIEATRLRLRAQSEFAAGNREAGMALEKQARELDSAATMGEFAPHEVYRRLAGEAEARLVQQRMNLTPEQRRMMPPWLSFDVPPEQQIVRY